jgi:hypothetical protein
MNQRHPGLGDDVLPQKLDGDSREVLESSAHLFEDGEKYLPRASTHDKKQQQQRSAPSSVQTS